MPGLEPMVLHVQGKLLVTELQINHDYCFKQRDQTWCKMKKSEGQSDYLGHFCSGLCAQWVNKQRVWADAIAELIR